MLHSIFNESKWSCICVLGSQFVLFPRFFLCNLELFWQVCYVFVFRFYFKSWFLRYTYEFSGEVFQMCGNFVFVFQFINLRIVKETFPTVWYFYFCFSIFQYLCLRFNIILTIYVTAQTRSGLSILTVPKL